MKLWKKRFAAASIGLVCAGSMPLAALKSGMAVSALEFPENTVAIGTLELTLEDLAAADYCVEIPVTCGLDEATKLTFGFMLDDGLTLNGKGYSSDAMMSICTQSSTNGSYWYAATDQDGYAATVTLKLVVSSDAAAGDVYAITAIGEDSTGVSACINDTEATVFSGGVEIIDDSDTASLAYGDVNLDGTINLADIIRVSRYVTGILELSDAAIEKADVNADGVVDANDALVLIRFQTRKISALPYAE